MSNFMKIHLLGTDLIPVGRQVDRQINRQKDGKTDRGVEGET
jgi:hypothetical protein